MFPLTREAKNLVKSLIKSKTENLLIQSFLNCT